MHSQESARDILKSPPTFRDAVRMPGQTKWSFDAEYITQCNCDWGCPCNFNARPNQGNCVGAGTWRITKRTFGSTKLDGVTFAAAYFFPGLIEQGNATSRMYVDTKVSSEQRGALEAIHTGKHGGGFFEVFPNLVSTSLPTKKARIDFRFKGAASSYKVDGIMELECEPIRYPDGMVISPTFELPPRNRVQEGPGSEREDLVDPRRNDARAPHEQVRGHRDREVQQQGLRRLGPRHPAAHDG